MNRLLLVPLPIVLFAAGCGGGEGDLPEIVSFNVDRTAIAAGETVKLTWETKNGKSVSISSTPIEAVSLTGLMASGEYTTGPIPVNTTFKLVVTSESRETVEKTVSVTTSGVGILSFTATPNMITRGAAVTLAYSLAGTAQSTKITAGDTEIYAGGPELMGSVEHSPEMNTTYTLTVVAAGGTITETATVEVSAVLPTIDSFNVTPSIIGEPFVVAWRTTNAREIQISLDGVVKKAWTTASAAVGTAQLTSTAETNTVRFEARNVDGMVFEDKVVTSLQRPVFSTFTLTPDSYNGTSVEATVTWATEFTTSLQLTVNNVVDPAFPATTLAGSYTFLASGGDVAVKLTAINPAAQTVREGVVAEGYIEPEPNDLPMEAIMLAGDGVGYRGTLDADDIDLYSVEVPEGGRIYAVAGVTPTGACTGDTAIRLFGSDGVTELGFVDDVAFPQIAPCAEMNPKVASYADTLPGGTYYIAIEGGALHTMAQPYRLIVRVSGPNAPLPGITYTEIGDPLWHVADCQLTSLRLIEGNTFDPFFASLNTLVRPLHDFDLVGANELVPEAAHTRPYDEEIAAMMGAHGFVSKTQFTEDEFTSPNGLMLLCSVLPIATATTGASYDSPDGLIIPYDLFPIVDQVSMERDQMPFSGDYMIGFSSYVDLAVSPLGAGASHRILWDGQTSMFADPPVPAPGSYRWRHTLTDTTGEGWRVDVNFEVQ